MPSRWYGAEPSWRLPFERDARRQYGPQLAVTETATSLTYRHQGIDVRGRPEPLAVTIRFQADPKYDTYGLAPADHPRIFADLGAASKHRMPSDGSLCLYYAADPIDRRWTADKGLLTLLDLAADHLFFEEYWRGTGGHRAGIWLGPEAEHGFQR